MENPNLVFSFSLQFTSDGASSATVECIMIKISERKIVSGCNSRFFGTFE